METIKPLAGAKITRNGNENQNALRISPKLLLSFFLIIPILAGVVLVDLFWLDGWVQSSLPNTLIGELFLIAVFLGTPHVVASFFSLADKEYFNFYKKNIFIAIFLAIFIFIAAFLAPALAAILSLIFSMYHILFQVEWISKSVLQNNDQRLRWWIWLLGGIFIFAYLLVFQNRIQIPDTFYKTIAVAPMVLIFLSLILSFVITKNNRSPYGAAYLLCIVALASFGYLFPLMGYAYFTVILVRVVHDLNSYTLYVTHDFNRNQTELKNIFFALFKHLKIPPYAILILASIAISYPLTQAAFLFGHNSYIAQTAIISLYWAHFFLERIIWHGNSLHRQYITIK
ncbi:MAG: hypothetical protein COT81_02305 [Candidatus Buchananbacteria bacterium CG10_big_fil_rev_8_21_14_0_10_42_9]|uniref:Beta-carotene 15,15'-dioxygenase n=1 Tax=Candidatus Buchananbacteria bacterium CG10_big_fil_rev_8_21_14_0_10_42_9 TaxID=1974526 RepID=A0A2H0W3W2_9BACT|nr:MAG: hypothetical protein COT81_02305 [Candidatus Buchananbacteria bacterium CG10_big_fil_rev_8_21_14_0_10_42_9]